MPYFKKLVLLIKSEIKKHDFKKKQARSHKRWPFGIYTSAQTYKFRSKITRRSNIEIIFNNIRKIVNIEQHKLFSTDNLVTIVLKTGVFFAFG